MIAWLSVFLSPYRTTTFWGLNCSVFVCLLGFIFWGGFWLRIDVSLVPSPVNLSVNSAPPAARPAAQPPAQQKSGGGGMLAGMASTMAQGFAFGTGSAVAHR